MKDNSVTIVVSADDIGKLIIPMKINEEEIVALGVYEIAGVRYWVVKPDDREAGKIKLLDWDYPAGLYKAVIDKVNELVNVVNALKK